MTREEYEQRKLRLEEQLRASIELTLIAHRQQMRALDLVWRSTAEEPLEELPAHWIDRALLAESWSPEAADLLKPKPRAPAVPPTEPAPPAPAHPRRRRSWELLDEVVAALARVPETFDRNDICRALGYEPGRSSLQRVLAQLCEEGVLALQERGAGQVPARYKATGAKLRHTYE